MSKNKKSLLRSLASVSGMTMISRLFGFARDMLMASYFGAGMATDAFNVAYKLPNLLRRVFAEGAFSQAFVPVLSEYKNTRTHQETREFVAAIMGMLGFILAIITVLGIIFSSGVIFLTAGGFMSDPVKYDLTTKLLRITFPYIFFISLASMMGGVLNTWGKFSIPSFTPTILNIVFITFILFFRNSFEPSILTLAWATFFGGLLQLGFQLPYLRKIDMLVMPKFDFKNKAVWRVIRLMGPAIFALSISQISMVINTIYASFLPSGSISWMYYADRLMEFPTGLLGVALGTILLPSLSKHACSGSKQDFSKILDWGIRLCLLLALPATVGLGLLAKELTMTLFMHGEFDMHDAIMTSYALIAYSIGLIGIILVKVLAPGFYANQDIKTPVKIALFVLACTQIMNLAFIGPLKHAGLSLSIGLSACINATALGVLLVKKGYYKPQTKFMPFLFRLVTAVLIMALSIELALHFLPLDFMHSMVYRIVSLSIVIIISIISYFGALFILGFRMRDFSHKGEF